MGNKVFVKNIHDGSRKPPSGYSSWLEYWIKNHHGAIPTKCPRSGTTFIRGKVHGAHVKKVNDPFDTPFNDSFDDILDAPFDDTRAVPRDDSWYIIPLCQNCNALKDDEPFEVDEDLLVPVNKQNKKQNKPQKSIDDYFSLGNFLQS